MRRFYQWSREFTIIPSKDKDGNYYYTILAMVLRMIIVNAVQSVIANAEGNDEAPLIKGLTDGTSKL